MQNECGIKIVNEKVENPKKQEQEHDPATALQMYLDHIPVSSIPSISTCRVVELKTGDTIKDAIQLLYHKNLCVALTADDQHQDSSSFGRICQHYWAYIDFASLILWSLQQCEKSVIRPNHNTFFTMLQHNTHIAQAKVGELAKSFFWKPFFPVHLEDTLVKI